MKQDVLLNIIESVEPKLWFYLGVVLVAATVGLFLKGRVENVVAYLNILTNKEL